MITCDDRLWSARVRAATAAAGLNTKLWNESPHPRYKLNDYVGRLIIQDRLSWWNELFLLHGSDMIGFYFIFGTIFDWQQKWWWLRIFQTAAGYLKSFFFYCMTDLWNEINKMKLKMAPLGGPPITKLLLLSSFLCLSVCLSVCLSFPLFVYCYGCLCLFLINAIEIKK